MTYVKETNNPGYSHSIDFVGSWSNTTGYNSNIYPDSNNVTTYSVDQALQYYINRGADPEFLVIGASFSGKAFKVANGTVNQSNMGLGMPVTGIPSVGELPDMVGNGTITYNGIQQLMANTQMAKRGYNFDGGQYMYGPDNNTNIGGYPGYDNGNGGSGGG
ncbi:Chitinase 1, partial [Smittium mucronatum]